MKRSKFIKIIVGIIFIILVVNNFYKYIQLKIDGKCTTGVVIGYYIGSKSAENTVYKYIVSGKIYKRSIMGYNPNKLKRTYKVLYYKKNPALSIIYLDNEVNSEIIKCENNNIFWKLANSGDVKENWEIYPK